MSDPVSVLIAAHRSAASIQAATAPLVAFIDDEELAGPDWMMHLLTRGRGGEYDVVSGAVACRYQQNAPRWVNLTNLRSIRPVVYASDQIKTGYTCNILIDGVAIGGCADDSNSHAPTAIAASRVGQVHDRVPIPKGVRRSLAAAMSTPKVVFRAIPAELPVMFPAWRRQRRRAVLYAAAIAKVAPQAGDRSF